MSRPQTPGDDPLVSIDAVRSEVAARTQGLASNAALTMVVNAIPTFSSATPKSESKAGAAGSVMQIPPADHQHPRLTSSTADGQTTAADGTATVTFTRAFVTTPAITLTAIENTTSAGPSMKVMKWKTRNAQGQLVDRSTQANSTETYDGCVVYAWRNRALPTQTPLTTGTLLAGVVTGVNNLIAALSGYEPYVPAGGVNFTCIAVQSSST